MALNIAAMQQPMNLVDQFIEGRALRQAEDIRGAQMTALQNAEGRAVAEEQRQQSKFNWEQGENQLKLDQTKAAQIKAGVDQVLAVPKGQRKQFVEKNFPDFVAKLGEQEYGWENVDEDEIEEMAKGLGAQSAAAMGKSPEKITPLSDAGKVEYDVKSGLLTGPQGDAILNAEKWTNPEPGVVDGKEAMVQYNQKGEARVVPGVSPRAQKPLVSIDQRDDTAANKAYGEAEGKAYSDVLQRGQDAQDKAQSLRVLLASTAKTGPTQDIRADANAFFKDLGVPIAQSKIDQITDLAQYKGVLNQTVLTEQLKQKGSQTESDAKRIQESFGKTTNIKEANDLILKYQLALAERESLLSGKAEEYRERTGKIDGWRKELRSYVRDTPLAAKNPKSGRLVFWNEYLEQMKQANPEATEDEIMGNWRQTYGAR